MGRTSTRRVPVALTIAGSDSGGGAGLQADLKTFAVHGVFGTSAITCLTAQNPAGVSGIVAVAPRMVTLQIQAVCDAFPVRAAKTGMLYSAPVIRAVASAIAANRLNNLVVDPVMVATSGRRLLKADAVAVLCRSLLPLARVVTPNLQEAEYLLGGGIASVTEMVQAARVLSERFGCAVVLKGGHLAGTRVHDVLVEGSRVVVVDSPRVAVKETHGTGCTFSAAMTASLAKGMSLEAAFRSAKRYVADALVAAVRAGSHSPLGWGLRSGRERIQPPLPC